MTSGPQRDGQIPAGFTYLGQFVDHDLTFDATTVALGEDISPADLLQGRSPTLDLDSLYGFGPDDAVSQKFYEADRTHLKVGTTTRIGNLIAREGFDLPRVGTGNQPRRANIPDQRNDENLAVAQHHAAFIRFHNRVVDRLPASIPAADRFRNARRLVVLHYQWMLKTDYLNRIVDPAIVTDVFANGRKVFEVGADPFSMPTMPVEFSVGAFRLGHSMVREAYDWNAEFPSGGGSLFLLVRLLPHQRHPGRFPDTPEQLDRRLAPALPLPPDRPPGPQSTAGRVQQRPPSRHRAGRPARRPAGRVLRRGRGRRRDAAGESRVPQPRPRRDAQAGQRPADGHLHEGAWCSTHQAHQGTAPRWAERCRPRPT